MSWKEGTSESSLTWHFPLFPLSSYLIKASPFSIPAQLKPARPAGAQQRQGRETGYSLGGKRGKSRVIRQVPAP